MEDLPPLFMDTPACVPLLMDDLPHYGQPCGWGSLLMGTMGGLPCWWALLGVGSPVDDFPVGGLPCG